MNRFLSTANPLLLLRTRRLYRPMILLAAILGALWAATASQPAQAFDLPNIPTPLIVTTTTLSNNDQDGQCDLWEALKTAFDLRYGGSGIYNECSAVGAQFNGSTVIAFAPSLWGETIYLPAGGPYPELPMIVSDVTLLGPVTLDGGGEAANQHIFVMGSGGELTLIGLTLTNGFTSGSGGAILNTYYGKINLIAVSMLNNNAQSDGGAIDTNGDIAITASNFSGNRALGLMSDGTSDASGVGYGGALNIYGNAKLNLTLSTFNGNIADKGGGAIHFSGYEMEVADTTFNGNLVIDQIPTDVEDALRGGGAIYLDNNATLKIERTAFDGNLSWVAPAGALFVAMDSTAEISDSSFNANAAGLPTNPEMGGAIYNTEALTVTRSAFYLNIATSDGGAIANDRGGQNRMYNVTLAGNLALGGGGALWNGNTLDNYLNSTTWAYHVTFSDNSAPSGSSIFIDTAEVNAIILGNTIVNQGIGISTPCNTNQYVSSNDHNIDSGISCGLSAPADQSSTDPMLEALGFNGGPIVSLLSMKLQPGSPALENAGSGICNENGINQQDQRGEKRPQDGTGSGDASCDVGAVENDGLKAGYGSIPVQPGPIHVGNANFGSTVLNSFTVFETGNHTLQITSAVLSGPDAAQFGVTTSFPQSIADGGTPLNLGLSCTPSGTNEGLRTAQLSLATNDPDHASVVYNLTCNGTATPVPGFASNPIPPGPIDFGAVLVNVSTAKTFTIFEIGNADLTLSNPSIQGANPGDFLLVTPLPLTIPNGAGSISLSVECNPQAYGARTATLSFQTNDPINPQVMFNLVCEGTLPPPPVLEEPGQTQGGGGIPALTNPYGAAISPDGRHVYVAGFISDSIEVFQRNLVTGQLSPIQSLGDPDGDLDGVYMLTISPDGTRVYAAAGVADNLVVFTRNPQSGLLSKVEVIDEGQGYGCFPAPCDGNVIGLDGIYEMAISPDGKFFYASGVNSDGIAVFRRGLDGSLVDLFNDPLFEQAYLDPTNLNGAYGIALSPDGKHLYATGYSSDTLVQLNRDFETGHLTYVTRYTATGPDALPGLNGVFRVAISPDGLYVYTSSFDGDSIVAFSRNPIDGSLTHIETYTDGVGGLTTLDAVTSTYISPDGRYLYATSYNDDALTVFTRNPLTGRLVLAQAIVRDSGSGLPGLDGARHVVVSPDGRLVVATGYLEHKVNAFLIANPTPLLESISPASVVAGSSGFILKLHGENFVLGAQVEMNGLPLETTRVGDTELEVPILANDITIPGTLSLRVKNPAPGGGYSNTLELMVTAVGENPRPSITALVPGGVMAGEPGMTIQVQGSGFLPASVVQWNGQPRSTSYVSETELRFSVDPADLAQPGAAGVRVENPGPGGGLSNAVRFVITAPGENPPPSLISISPDWMYSRGPASPSIQIIVNGTNFVEGSHVLWNGKPLPTQFIHSGELRTTINAAQLAWPGTASVSAQNPAPGGGNSNTLIFTIKPFYQVFLPGLRR